MVKKMVKKVLITLCALTCLGLAIVLGFQYYSAQKSAEYAPTAVPYIKQVIPQLTQWEPELSHRLMSEESLRKIPRDYFDRVVKAMSQLGTLEELQEPEFAEVYSGSTLKGEDQTIISYTVNARFSSGPAEIQISLADKNGNFEVNSFNVHSEVLRQK